MVCKVRTAFDHYEAPLFLFIQMTPLVFSPDLFMSHSRHYMTSFINVLTYPLLVNVLWLLLFCLLQNVHLIDLMVIFTSIHYIYVDYINI